MSAVAILVTSLLTTIDETPRRTVVLVDEPELRGQSKAIPDTQVKSDAVERLKQVEDQLKKLADAEAKRKEDSAKKPTFVIGGQLQVDYLAFGQDAGSRAAVGDVNDGVYFRRARITGRGEAFDVVEYGIGFDFALPGRPSFVDVFVGVFDLPYLGTVRAGHFFEPFSLERVTLNRYNTFMERSLADSFAPARNTGIAAYNTIGGEQRGTWAVGVFASDSDNFGDQFTDAGGQAVTGRLTWLPFYDDATDGRSYVHLGACVSHRTPTGGAFTFQSFPEARPGAPSAASVPPFVNTGAIPARDAQLFDAEFVWTVGPLSVQAEFIGAPVSQIGGPDLFFHGGYAYVSYFITGEHRPYNKAVGFHDRVIPFENFFRVRTCDGPIVTGCGAWEVAARCSYIDLSDANVQGGVERNVTLGLNWYLNPFARVKWEYVYADLDRLPLGQGNTHIFGMRVDIDF